MIDYALNYCYGVIVSSDFVHAFTDTLSDELSDEFYDSDFVRSVNAWIGDTYFIGIMSHLTDGAEDYVYPISTLQHSEEDIEELANFLTKYRLFKDFFDRKPQNYLINFCY